MKAETIIAVLLSISMMTASVEPAHAVDSYRHTTKAFNVWRFASFLCCRFRFMFFMFNYVRPTDGCSGIRRNTTNWVVGLWNCRNKQEEQLKVFTLQRVGERKWQKNQFLGLPFSYLPMSCLNFLVYHFQVCHWTHFSYVPMLTKWFGLMCILNHLPVTQTTLLLLVDLHAATAARHRCHWHTSPPWGQIYRRPHCHCRRGTAVFHAMPDRLLIQGLSTGCV